MVPIDLLVLLMSKTQQDLHLGTGVKTKKHPRHSAIWFHSNLQEIHKQMQSKFVTLLPIISWTKDMHISNGKNVEDFRDYNLM